MLSLLPDYADPERLCSLGKAYEGRLMLSDLPRLSAMLRETGGDAAFHLAFATDSEKRPVVSLAVEADLVVECQRCLEPMVLRVESQARLAVVTGPEEAGRLPRELDPLLTDGGPISLKGLIEEELILAVPNAPMHAKAACAVDLHEVNVATDKAPLRQPRHEARHESPFAVLAGLKRHDQDENQ